MTVSSANPESSIGPISAPPSSPPTAWPSTRRSACLPSPNWVPWATASPPQRFLGMINFYRHFLPGVAGTLRPLTAALSGNPKTLPWTPNMETAFTAAKAAFVAAVPLAHPLPGAVRHPCRSCPATTGRPALPAAGISHQKALQIRGKLFHLRPRTPRRRVRYKTLPLTA